MEMESTMSKNAGRFLGLTLAVIIFGTGIYGFIAIVNVIHNTAEPLALWFGLGASAVAIALGVFMITQWTSVDEARQARH